MSNDVPPNGNYDYFPNKPAAILFAVLFGLALVAHSYHVIRTKSWWIIPLIVGLVLETEGYIFRYFSAKQFFNQGFLIISQVGIIVAPAFFAAQDYMIVGRMMAYVGPGNALVGHGIITKIFVGADVVAILSQAAGGSMLSSKNINTIKVGRVVLIFGLAFQVISFGIFLFITIAFHRKALRSLGDKLKPLRPLFISFYVSAGLIIIRSIYRTCEFASIKIDVSQAAGYVLTHEWVVYVGDSLLMIIAVSIFLVNHPTRFLPRKKGLRMDGSYEEESSGGCCGCFGRRKARLRSTETIQMVGP